MRPVFVLITLAVLSHLCQRVQALPVFSTTFVLPEPAAAVTSTHVLQYLETYLNIDFVAESQVSLTERP